MAKRKPAPDAQVGFALAGLDAHGEAQRTARAATQKAPPVAKVHEAAQTTPTRPRGAPWPGATRCEAGECWEWIPPGETSCPWCGARVVTHERRDWWRVVAAECPDGLRPDAHPGKRCHVQLQGSRAVRCVPAEEARTAYGITLASHTYLPVGGLRAGERTTDAYRMAEATW